MPNPNKKKSDGDKKKPKKEKPLTGNEPKVSNRLGPHLNEYLLLCIQYVCSENGIKIPYDEVAQLFDSNASDSAIGQHLARIRVKRTEKGLKNPPNLQRGHGRASGTSTKHKPWDKDDLKQTAEELKPVTPRDRKRQAGEKAVKEPEFFDDSEDNLVIEAKLKGKRARLIKGKGKFKASDTDETQFGGKSQLLDDTEEEVLPVKKRTRVDAGIEPAADKDNLSTLQSISRRNEVLQKKSLVVKIKLPAGFLRGTLSQGNPGPVNDNKTIHDAEHAESELISAASSSEDDAGGQKRKALISSSGDEDTDGSDSDSSEDSGAADVHMTQPQALIRSVPIRYAEPTHALTAATNQMVAPKNMLVTPSVVHTNANLPNPSNSSGDRAFGTYQGIHWRPEALHGTDELPFNYHANDMETVNPLDLHRNYDAATTPPMAGIVPPPMDMSDFWYYYANLTSGDQSTQAAPEVDSYTGNEGEDFGDDFSEWINWEGAASEDQQDSKDGGADQMTEDMKDDNRSNEDGPG
ncbi:MAG: hypothetical protein M1833_003329 [Piccolia ochrophora]|nr:MAG: hypothetical protein M1833_003329 [Piccolia ochrophora]